MKLKGMRAFTKFLAIIALPFLVMVIVNESMSTPKWEYTETKCSRYCHNKGCSHTIDKYNSDDLTETQVKMARLYNANIVWLKKNPLGLSYQAMNILLYVIVFPLLLYLLLWGLVRPLKRIHPVNYTPMKFWGSSLV